MTKEGRKNQGEEYWRKKRRSCRRRCRERQTKGKNSGKNRKEVNFNKIIYFNSSTCKFRLCYGTAAAFREEQLAHVMCTYDGSGGSSGRGEAIGDRGNGCPMLIIKILLFLISLSFGNNY